MKLKLNFPTTKLSKADEAVLKSARKSKQPIIAVEAESDDSVPTGKLIAGHHIGTDVYPDHERDFWVYVPAQYDADTPANLMVFQDGASYLEHTKATTVFDNLIASGDLAPTIALFIQPGDTPGATKDSKANRSMEYDHISDAYARFLHDELLPAAIGDYNVTDDPKKRAICGMSSGGICAFNVAWERPDSFGLVLSHVGSFTNIRGGHIYPSRIRQNAPRDMRVFLQDGVADLNHWLGNWAIANFDMASALTFKGYDMRFEFGKGAHTFDHAAAILPQTLRWLFRN